MKAELKLLFASAAFLAVLTAVDVEKAVATATPGPTTVNDFEAMTTTALGYPLLEVLGMRTVYALEDQQTKSATHEINLEWTMVGDDGATITKQLENLVRATRDFLWPAQGPSPLAMLSTWPVVIVSEEYGELAPSPTHVFVKGSATRIQVKTETL